MYCSFPLFESSSEWGSLSGAPVLGLSFWQTKLLVDFLPFSLNKMLEMCFKLDWIQYIHVFSGQKTGGQELVGGLDCTVHRNFFGSQVTLVSHVGLCCQNG